jgi:ABC-type sugar transport system permease subunit
VLTEVLFAALSVGVAPLVWLALSLVLESAKLKLRGIFSADYKYD